jgi:membrane-associated phospholipid phosphatase
MNLLSRTSVLMTLTLVLVLPRAQASTNEDIGDVIYVALPVAGLLTATLKHDRDGQFQFLKSIAANTVLTVGLKSAIDKRRPDGICCNSFPSGHTSYTFMSATFVNKRYGRKYGIPAYAAATFVAYSRVFADRHYVEDVIAGAAIGYLSATLFTTEYRGVEVYPVAAGDFLGIGFSKSW